MTFGFVLVVLMLGATSCVQAEKLVVPGNLGAAVKVSGDLDIVLIQPKADSADVYAVAFAAVETTSAIFCKKSKADTCEGRKTFNMVFQKKEQAGFYFISSSPLNFDEGAEIQFLSYISVNGIEPSQKGTAVFKLGQVASDDALDRSISDNQSDTAIANPTGPTPNNDGLNTTTLIDLFAGILGGGNTNATPPSTPQNPSTPPANPVVPPTPIAGTPQTDASLVPNPDNVQITASEFEVVKLTNAERVRRGKTALIVQQRIMVTSRESSRLMQQRSNLVHGLTSGWSGENIAMGYSSPAQVVQGWIRSPGHYANMMGNFKYIGVGDTIDRGGRPYWTQQFNR